jgi:hypothetical protein
MELSTSRFLLSNMRGRLNLAAQWLSSSLELTKRANLLSTMRLLLMAARSCQVLDVETTGALPLRLSRQRFSGKPRD